MPKHPGALEVWREKLDHLLEQEPKEADHNRRFQIRQDIAEAQAKIAELEGNAKEALKLRQDKLLALLRQEIAATDEEIKSRLQQEISGNQVKIESLIARNRRNTQLLRIERCLILVMALTLSLFVWEIASYLLGGTLRKQQTHQLEQQAEVLRQSELLRHKLEKQSELLQQQIEQQPAPPSQQMEQQAELLRQAELLHQKLERQAELLRQQVERLPDPLRQQMKQQPKRSADPASVRAQLLDIIYTQTCGSPEDPTTCRPVANKRAIQEAVLAFVDAERDRELQIDLRGANLAGMILPGADLSNADLSNADLSNTDLSNADLSKAILQGAKFKGVNLSGALLVDAILIGAKLDEANLTDADLSGANLSRASFGYNQKGAKLNLANLCGVHLYRSKNFTLEQLQDACGCKSTRAQMRPTSWDRQGCRERWPDNEN